MPNDALDYSLHFEELPEYLKVWVSGREDTYEVSIQFWADIHARFETLDVNRLMVIEDFPNQVSAGEIFEVAERLPILFPRARLAFVDLNLPDMELNQLGEDVAVNRGLVGKVFNDPTKAERWLLEEE